MLPDLRSLHPQTLGDDPRHRDGERRAQRHQIPDRRIASRDKSKARALSPATRRKSNRSHELSSPAGFEPAGKRVYLAADDGVAGWRDRAFFSALLLPARRASRIDPAGTLRSE